ncbi:lipid-A-disaccharide synthase [Luteimonas endophytica]|uniref:lipid-A-disaccharide synthase n=1 Tax=Luteimonas endophytica TaxID=3042023 RepID=UPI003CE55A9A
MNSAPDPAATVDTPAPAAAPPARPVPRFALVAGEASGDQLGAGLIRELRQRHPHALFAGVGGDAMRAAGLDAWHDASELAVMGLSEVLSHLPRLLMLRAALRRRILAWRPDAFIGIDAPDFNLGLERMLRLRGVRTVHYVSPSVWAWRRGRARSIGRSADRVLCLFPMEPEIYAGYGVDARFVGHPMADAMPLDPDRRAARARLDVARDATVLAVLPGSRLGEIGRLAEVFLEAAALVAAEVPGLLVLVPAADARCAEALRARIAASPLRGAGVRLLDGQAREAMVAADAVLLASGTATLEGMLAKRPMVVGYRVARATSILVRALGLLKIERYALPNVLAGEELVPELMQERCTAPDLAAAVLGWLRDPRAVAALEPRFRQIHATLRRDASARAADVVEALVARR